jgi:hypothetical protein
VGRHGRLFAQERSNGGGNQGKSDLYDDKLPLVGRQLLQDQRSKLINRLLIHCAPLKAGRNA